MPVRTTPSLRGVAAVVRMAFAALRLGGSTRPVGPPSSPPAAGDAAGQGTPEPPVWRSAADLVPSAVLILDEEGHVLDANLAAAELAGAERSSLRHRSLVDLVDPADRHRAATVWRRPFRQRRGWRLNIRTATSPIPVAFDCWPVRIGDQDRLVLIGREPRDDPGGTLPSTARVAGRAGLGDGEPAPM